MVPPGAGARSIPACAGEAVKSGGRGRKRQVYPRVCGGSGGANYSSAQALGLSPRVRGKQGQRADALAAAGSIPACAGEAQLVRGGGAANEVYPRVCGGSIALHEPIRIAWGLSPRVRGKLQRLVGILVRRGSIPACAGEARGRGKRGGRNRVYPRVCGGSYRTFGIGRNPVGLSPRVRGKLWQRGKAPPPLRSIPACAGEASLAGRHCRPASVYPRVCGGSSAYLTKRVPRPGLSPRVRGKRIPFVNGRLDDRSIPACAGEALPGAWRSSWPAVYPRVCGGSAAARQNAIRSAGLSPRVRGKRPSPARNGA